jgi:hypothetical protein
MEPEIVVRSYTNPPSHGSPLMAMYHKDDRSMGDFLYEGGELQNVHRMWSLFCVKADYLSVDRPSRSLILSLG